MDSLQAMYGDISDEEEEEENDHENQSQTRDDQDDNGDFVVNDLEIAAANAQASLEEEAELYPEDENTIDVDEYVVKTADSQQQQIAPDLLAAAAAAAPDETTEIGYRNQELDDIRKQVEAYEQQTNEETRGAAEEEDDASVGSSSSSDTSEVGVSVQPDEVGNNQGEGEEAEEEGIGEEEEEDTQGAPSSPVSAHKPRTKHEILPDEREEEPLQIDLENISEVVPVGHVMNVNKQEKVILVEGIKNSPALDEGSILCLRIETPEAASDMRQFLRVLGAIDEVFGPVNNPFYIIRLRKDQLTHDNVASSATKHGESSTRNVPWAHAQEVETTQPIYALQDYMKYVDTRFCFVKGSDASNMHDEEPAPEEVEYSDDEEEAEARARLRNMKKGKQSAADLNVENAEEAMGNISPKKGNRGSGKRVRGKHNRDHSGASLGTNATQVSHGYPPEGLPQPQQEQMIQQMQMQMAQMQAQMQYQQQLLQSQGTSVPGVPMANNDGTNPGNYAPGSFHLFSNTQSTNINSSNNAPSSAERKEK